MTDTAIKNESTPHLTNALKSGMFSVNLRALALATVCLAGCGTEPPEKPQKGEATTETLSSSNLTVAEVKSPYLDRYFFKPPLVAPKEFVSAVSSPNGFSESEAFYINNGAYFVFRALEAERPDLAKEFQKLKFAPFSPDMLTTEVPGGKFPFGIYENGTIYINVRSKEFSTAGQAFFPLARTIAHEFCHHIAGDKAIEDLGADATRLFSMEVIAHERTQAIGEITRRFVTTIPDASRADIELWQRELTFATQYAKAYELRYLIRRDVCQNIFNQVDAIGNALKKEGKMTDAIDQHIGGIMVLAVQLRDAGEDGPEELAGYQTLVHETNLFAAGIKPLSPTLATKLGESLLKMQGLLMQQEHMLLELRSPRGLK